MRPYYLLQKQNIFGLTKYDIDKIIYNINLNIVYNYLIVFYSDSKFDSFILVSSKYSYLTIYFDLYTF